MLVMLICTYFTLTHLLSLCSVLPTARLAFKMSWQKSLADKLGLNVKDFNLLRYLVMAAIVIIGVLYSLANATDTLGDPVKLLGYLTALAFAHHMGNGRLSQAALEALERHMPSIWFVVPQTDSFSPLRSSYGSYDHKL
jgi:hypothetical protein